jgi:hypothetical protein
MSHWASNKGSKCLAKCNGQKLLALLDCAKAETYSWLKPAKTIAPPNKAESFPRGRKGHASVDFIFGFHGIATLDRPAGMKLRGGLSVSNGLVRPFS